MPLLQKKYSSKIRTIFFISTNIFYRPIQGAYNKFFLNKKYRITDNFIEHIVNIWECVTPLCGLKLLTISFLTCALLEQIMVGEFNVAVRSSPGLPQTVMNGFICFTRKLHANSRLVLSNSRQPSLPKFFHSRHSL
jgi:hypothetical protein